MTEDELRTIVAVGHEKGVIETDEKNMINNVFDLDDSVAGDIMVPRVNMTFIDIDANYEELMEKFFEGEAFTTEEIVPTSCDTMTIAMRAFSSCSVR